MNLITIRPIFLCLLCVTFCYSATSVEQTDDFEGYPQGNIDGQGEWFDFGGEMPSEISSDFSFSGEKSLKQTIGPTANNPVDVGYGSDLFIDLSEKRTQGRWNLSYQIYVPSNFDGAAIAFISEGRIDEGDFDTGMYLVADGTTSFNEFLHSVDGGTPASTPHTLIRDQWVKVDSMIDLDANTVDVLYGDNLLFSGPWDPVAPSPLPENDIQAIGGFNFWVQGGTGGSVYYDDITLMIIPEPSGFLLALLALIGIRAFLSRPFESEA